MNGPTPDMPGAATAAPDDAARTVLFDFDGVLFRGDALGQFIRSRYRGGRWRLPLLLPLVPWLLLGWPISWRLPVRSLIHLGLLGTGTRRYRRLAEAFAATLARRPRQFHRDALQALRRHIAAGDRVWVVTGCEAVLAGAVLRELGLTDVGLVASQLRPGWTGMRLAHHNVGRAKVAALAAAGIGGWRVAYSDSAQDLPMLAKAAEPVLVNASPALCKRVEKTLGRAVARVAWN